MFFDNWLKKLRKRWRLNRKRRFGWMAFWTITCVISGYVMFTSKLQTSDLFEERTATISASIPLEDEENFSGEKEVLLVTKYICGEEVESIGSMSNEELQEYKRSYTDRTVEVLDNDVVHFIRHKNDLAPVCKNNAYFGLDSEGNLTLYDGKPEEKQVIQTFFQLHIQQLESSLPRGSIELLYSGIRIHDLDDYNSVLSSFSSYAK